MKFICLSSLFFFVSCMGGDSQQNNIFPLVNGECEYLKDHYLDNEIIHISKRLVGDELKCVMEFYLQVEDQAVPVNTVKEEDLAQ